MSELLVSINIALLCLLMCFAHISFFAVSKVSLGKKKNTQPIFQMKFKRKASMEFYLSQLLFSGIQHRISTMQISI